MSEDERGPGSVDRRSFLRAAALAGTAGGLTTLAAPASAMRVAPRPRPDGHLQPAVIAPENGDPIEGQLDLLTLDVSGPPRGPQLVGFEFLVDTLREGSSVQPLTEKIHALAHVDGELHRPPVCVVTWGRGFRFQGMLQESFGGFTMFKEDGTPLRATVAVHFETIDPSDFDRR